jgi:hypothetical protein
MLAWVAAKLGRPVTVVQKRWVTAIRPLPEGIKPRTAEWTDEEVFTSVVQCQCLLSNSLFFSLIKLHFELFWKVVVLK